MKTVITKVIIPIVATGAIGYAYVRGLNKVPDVEKTQTEQVDTTKNQQELDSIANTNKAFIEMN